MNTGLTTLAAEVIAAIAVDGSNLFVGTGDGVFLSTDSGLSWHGINDGLTDLYVLALAAKDNILFAGTSSGRVWRRSISEIIATNSVVEHPQAKSIAQAFPNPLTHSTTIRFSSTESGFAQVTIVNLLGETVAQLFEGELEAGEHSFEWNASDFPAGTYFCLIREGAAARMTDHVGGALHEVPMLLAR